MFGSSSRRSNDSVVELLDSINILSSHKLHLIIRVWDDVLNLVEDPGDEINVLLNDPLDVLFDLCLALDVWLVGVDSVSHVLPSLRWLMIPLI